MNILLVTSIYPPDIGGPATYTSNLARTLSVRHSVKVITFSKPNKKVKQTFSVYFVPTNGGMLQRQFKLVKMIHNHLKQANVIFCQDALVVGVASALVAKLLHKPLVVKFVGDIVWEEAQRRGVTNKSLEEYYASKQFSIRQRIYSMLQHWVLIQAQKVITPSKYLKDFLVRTYDIPVNNIQVIYNGVDIKTRIHDVKEAYAVTVCRLVRWKNVDGILKAVAQVPGLVYKIVGSGPERKKLVQLCADMGISDRVSFLGRCSQKQVSELLHKSNIFVLNSTYEGLPHVLLEAALTKNAIIAPDLPGIKEVFNKKEAQLFSVGSDHELKCHLHKIAADSSLVSRLGNNAYQKVSSQFSWSRTVADTESLLKVIAG